MKKTVLVFLADGFEEVEAVTPVDFLRRAGVEVMTVGVEGSKTVTGSHGVPVVADRTILEIGFLPYDAVILPGGMPGSANLAASGRAGSLVREAVVKGKLVAAICAAPAVVLAPLGILAGKTYTCFPGMEKDVCGATWVADDVAVDGNIITSRGAGTAALFALAVIEYLLGREAAEKIGKATLVLR
ncbi:MAG: DJ-1/PfpI family protein [Spirochaetaceae bacterium]|jgi:4-methyl-5(b-hydroxyethyl)-thiazole monophosphate biosynthesis|nr:DJ-1/PfpI family protein [Spirochaetaceae bacterium]